MAMQASSGICSRKSTAAARLGEDTMHSALARE